jgi:thiamine pyrophosphate-dependent acetolactate synthase large subunit-like protein
MASSRPGEGEPIPVGEALRLLARLRGPEQVVITSMGAARQWPAIASHPLDFHYMPSTMGGAIPLALGLALAQPRREVMVLTGDGSLLMSLGVLVTTVQTRATNLTVVLMDNGVYEVTGGQQTPASGFTDFAGMARAAGFRSEARVSLDHGWQEQAARLLSAPGPRFLWLLIDTVRDGQFGPPPGPLLPRWQRLRDALQGS